MLLLLLFCSVLIIKCETKLTASIKKSKSMLIKDVLDKTKECNIFFLCVCANVDVFKATYKLTSNENNEAIEMIYLHALCGSCEDGKPNKRHACIALLSQHFENNFLFQAVSEDGLMLSTGRILSHRLVQTVGAAHF